MTSTNASRDQADVATEGYRSGNLLVDGAG